eukprot:Nitzschia sp. Nitz4//scaffold7_size249615//98186//100242//NITZ4_001167-RA/size249615-augustus-gene-0.7-mRNA-1//1//CDS//3329558412//8348//frame0
MSETKESPVLVFGISGEQGRSVVEGFVEAGYSPVYGFTSSSDTLKDPYLADALDCVVLEGSLGVRKDVQDALLSTKAQTIFLTTTTELPMELENGYQLNQEEEYRVIVQFFQVLQEVYKQDQLPRTVVFSSQVNVQELCQKYFKDTGSTWIEPLDDGSIVPHFSAKGKGGEMALQLLKDEPDLKLVLLIPPFFYSNFLAFFTPIPNDGRTQWELCGSFGDGATKLDMMNCGDLGKLMVAIAKDPAKYDGRTLKVAAEKISMDEVAQIFSDIYGKDVIYNPLLPSELSQMEFASAGAMAQMCQFLGTKHLHENMEHDTELTAQLLAPRKPTTFEDWLLTHNDSTVFSRVGLAIDGPEITNVCVFGAMSPQGQSVIQSLLANNRTCYDICATTRRDLESKEVKEMIEKCLDRVKFARADFNDVASCQKAVIGMDAAFLVADLYREAKDNGSKEQEEEERHARNVIDACAGNVRHLVISSFESPLNVDSSMPGAEFLEFSSRARIAAYARSKQLSVTFVLMPCYDEAIFESTNTEGKTVVKISAGRRTNQVYVGLDELGTTAANIFSSYQCYAGHEIGVVTEFARVTSVKNGATEAEAGKPQLTIGDTYMKDLGQLFVGMSHLDAVARRETVARNLELVPKLQNLSRWIDQNSDNPEFREKLGLR